ncbi:hypothetical protein PS15p_209213 [Mucor circinelloides]
MFLNPVETAFFDYEELVIFGVVEDVVGQADSSSEFGVRFDKLSITNLTTRLALSEVTVSLGKLIELAKP